MRHVVFLRVSALLVLALVAISCSSEPEDTEPTDAAAAPTEGADIEGASTDAEESVEPTATEAEDEATATEEEAADGGGGGTLVVAISADPGQLNPAITTSGGTHTATEIMYSGLVRLTPEGEPEGDLAESWEITDDGATYTFTLRDDVVWHDGEPFTSEDVAFSFNEVLLEFHSRTSASLGGALESIETPDDTTVVFNFSQPYAPLLQQLDVTEAPIVAEHVYGDVDDIQEAEANLAPVGTGPFRFVSYTPDSEIRLERHPDYHVEGLPLLDELVMQIIPEESSQVIALEAGEVDWLWGAPGPELERLEASGDYGFLQTATNPGGANCIMTVSFNLDRPALQDVAVRRAFAQALDRQVFVDNILFGAGRVAEAPISSGIPFAHAEGLDMPQFDPEAANALLDEAGWVREGDGIRTAQGVEGVEDGAPLSFNFVAFPNFSPYGEVMREQLAAVGIELTIEATEQSAFPDRVFVNRDYDTNIISYCNGPDPEIGVRRMYTTENIQPIPFSNAAGYSDPDVDRLFDEARAEVDPETRGELYRELQEILVEDLPYFWIVETESIRVHTAACEGFLPYGPFAEGASCDT